MSVINSQSIVDPKLSWFREARFGMFIHFGLYALLGRGEWVQYFENIPRETYEKLKDQFNPDRFNADEWVDLAEKAGCRYICLTTKHHDGFCLFDSALTDFNITKSPFKRDLVGELVAACHRRGMRICLYYSQPDWHHPNFVHLPGAFKDLPVVPSDQIPDWAKYIRYFHGQVRELCTKYGRIDGIWFDGSHKQEQAWGGRRVYRLIKQHQPGAVVNDRSGYGDIFTPERSLPDDLEGYMHECCQAVTATHWGYDPTDSHFSLPHLVETLARVVAHGGNLLLNVGPMPDGRIPEEQASRMVAVGRWLATCGEAVYGTEAGRIDTGSKDVVASRKGDTLYLFFCKWPDTDRLVVPGIRSLPTTATLLSSSAAVAAHSTEAGLELKLPPIGPDPVLNVVKLKFSAQPDLLAPVPVPLPQAKLVRLPSRGEAVLSVLDAGVAGHTIKGGRLHVDRRSVEPTAAVRNWMNRDQRLVWLVDAPQAGVYAVRIQLSCPEPFQGSTFTLRAGEGRLSGVVPATKTFDDYDWQMLGEIRLPAGTSRLTLQPEKIPYGYLFAHVAGISLRRRKERDAVGNKR